MYRFAVKNNMHFISILIISVSLAMDAFTVSIGQGIIHKKNRLKLALKAAGSFGFFQVIMPFIGWMLGYLISGIEDYDHWIAFGLLGIAGGRMIYEARKDELKKSKSLSLGAFELFILSIATSIDALIVGFSLSLLKVDLVMPLIMFGSITFLFSIIGIFIGNKLGTILGNKAEIAGGVLLIAIGVKILTEHLFA